MERSAEQLVDQAVAYKRAGSFELAKKCYIEAIELDPYNMTTYIGLGKTGYLLKNQSLAVRSYLAATHLQIAPIEKAIIENDLPVHLKLHYDNFPEEILATLPKKSAFTIFVDINTPRHLAHSAIDLSPSMLEENPELVPFTEIYRAHILGNGTHEDTLRRFGLTGDHQIATDQNIYIPFGRNFVLGELKWDQLESSNVLGLYFT